jgi:hypothetical protein
MTSSNGICFCGIVPVAGTLTTVLVIVASATLTFDAQSVVLSTSFSSFH